MHADGNAGRCLNDPPTTSTRCRPSPRHPPSVSLHPRPNTHSLASACASHGPTDRRPQAPTWPRPRMPDTPASYDRRCPSIGDCLTDRPQPRALRRRGGSQARRPAEPVTVVVPTNAIGVTARRLLGGRARPGSGHHRRGGGHLPHRYASPAVRSAPRARRRRATACRLPCSPPIRQVLARQPGMFAAVAAPAPNGAGRRATRARSATTELSARPTHRPAAPRVRIVGARRMLAPDWFDATSDAAVATIAATAPAGDLGAIVLYPRKHEPSASRACAAEHVGDGDRRHDRQRADVGVRASVRLTDHRTIRTTCLAGRTPHAPIVWLRPRRRSAPAVAWDRRHARRRGTRTHRCSRAPTCTRLLHEQLAATGTRTTAPRCTPQGVLGVIARAVGAPDATTVTTSWRCSPVRPAPATVTPSVGALGRHQPTPGTCSGAVGCGAARRPHAGVLHAEERHRTDREPRTGWYEHELTATRSLREFVAELREELCAAPRRARVGALAEWAQHLIDDASQAPSAIRPDVERQAAEARWKRRFRRLAGSARWSPPGLTCFAAPSLVSTPTSVVGRPARRARRADRHGRRARPRSG